jgi:hypothetical protein
VGGARQHATPPSHRPRGPSKELGNPSD